MLVALIVALPVRAYAAVRRNRIDRVVLSAASQVGLAIPAFSTGILLVLLFAVRLRWLPAGGYEPLSVVGVSQWAPLLGAARALAGAHPGVGVVRYVRSAVIDVIQDYFHTARSLGWPYLGALWRHRFATSRSLCSP
ncbi:MAG: ABC transporter permease subunit [Tessaracoccus sp.]